MAKQACIGAFGLAKPPGHIRIWNIVNLVGSRAEQERVHDARHVAGNALASFGTGRMMRMPGELRCVLELRVASRAHLVGIVAKLQSREVC